ncbi:PAS domain-containing sensor histidine kinase [Gimesia maris]|uniref:histidine kinase n=2 Tax=Gimesia maris TaxID=122 RepID=A0ABX5YWJ6_9PLAN|nr:PAS domain-containing protein [Gimesia maris]EDL61028.1 sensor histidine kinase [Gimesia maris DSM 8797]QEG20045.1 Sensor protein FixL [Gimesia maris]
MPELTTVELLEEVKTLRRRVAELEQQQAERNSNKVQDLAHQYFNLVGEMIIAIDTNQTVNLINRQGSLLLEAEESEIIGKNWFDHFLPDANREEVRALFEKLIQGDLMPVEYFENEIITASGRLKSIAWHNSLLRDAADRIIGTLSVGVDITARKETEQALRENDQMFRQISENINELFWVCSPDWREVYYASQMYEVIWGRSCQSLYDDPRSCLDAIHPDDRESVESEIRATSENGLSNSEFPRFRIIHKNGSVRWMQVRAFPVYDDNHRVTRIVGIGVDITSRKQEEDAVHRENAELERCVEERTEELARRTAQLKAMFIAIPDVVLVLNRNGEIINFNSRSKMDYFLSPTLHRGSIIWKVLPGNVRSQMKLLINRVYDSQQIETLDYCLVKQEKKSWYRARVLPYLSDEFLMMIEQINDQKIAEMELKDLHEKLSEAQRLAHIGSWEWCIKDDTIWWSDEVYRIFGVTKSDIILTNEFFLQTIHPEDRPLVDQMIAQSLKFDLPYSIEHRILRPDGEVRHVHERALLKKNDEGEVLFMNGTVQDMTERYEAIRKAQEYRDILAHASRLAVMGELTAGISHELNQPLTAIANYTAAMRQHLNENREMTHLVDKVQELSLRSGEIVRKLKSLAEKRTLQAIQFNIQESIRSALELIQYELRHRQIEVKIESQTKFMVVYADRVQIEQVLANLFINALEAMAESSYPRKLTINVSSAEDSMILVAITDTGNGVPGDFVDHLFTPFTTNKKDGLGIGLSLSRSLVEAAGGRIYYRSTSERGACFHLLLPTRPCRK